MKKTLTTLLLLLVLSSPLATAQTSGNIAGTVKDTTDAVLPGVEISVKNPATGLLRQTASDGAGRFSVAALPVGLYELRASLPGFRTLVRYGLFVAVGETLAVSLTLEVGAAEGEEVLVTAGRSSIQTQTSDLSYLVEEETLRELPLNGRNYTDLALLQPGVIAYRHRDTFGSIVAHGLGASVTGRDPRSNVYLLDGTPQNDFTNGPAGSAASTALGIETVQEFQVATQNYSAEFGRTFGGQINVVTKSGTNDVHGSGYYFHRNDNLDARNFFDRGDTPEFKRHQFGGTVGGPIAQDRWFYFLGYEGLREGLGRSLTTVVPDENARKGLVPSPSDPGQLIPVGVDPAVAPFLNEFPLPNGPNLGGGLAVHDWEFDQDLDQDFFQARIDHSGERRQYFVRYTFDDAEILLPTDFQQFPRTFLSRNQFATAQYSDVMSSRTVLTLRGSFSRTRIGQDVQANTTNPLPPFVSTRSVVGDIDIGGIPRFGPQVSVDVSLVQNVFGLEGVVAHTRGAHTLKFGGLVERYQDNMVNPTFSLGIYRFADLTRFLQNRPILFLGLGPEGELDRYWRFTLFSGFLQDDFRVGRTVTLNLGLRYEFSTLPKEIYGRDVTMKSILDPEVTVGKVYENPTKTNLSPRVGIAWDLFGDGTTALRGGYGLFFSTNNQQNLIVTVTNPPFTPRFVIRNPTFPNPPFDKGVGNSVRPIQYDLKNPRVHVWSASLQRQLWRDTVLTVGYAGSKGEYLLRNSDVNIPTPERLADGTLFWPQGGSRPNPNFGTIEQKTSDGNSWYNGLTVDLRKRWGGDFSLQSSYTFARSIDTTQSSTFFSDASNGTTSAFPEFGTDYNKGLSDFQAKHNWVFNFIWQIPFARDLSPGLRSVLDGWQLAGIANLQSGNPLTAFVQSNRSRSQWAPSINPATGLDRPSLAPGYTHQSAVLGSPDGYFDPNAFVLQPAGTLGNLGRGTFIGPDLRTFDLEASKSFAWDWQGQEVALQLRFEAFNLFNRTNFAPPSLLAFAGTSNNESPLSSFGRIRSTATSSRQIQVGLRFVF